MESILFVGLIVCMLLVVPILAATYMYYIKSKVTTAEWAKEALKEENRIKEVQKNPIWWSMHL